MTIAVEDDIIVKEGGIEYKQLPVGNYQAVCFAVWDIGLQEGSYNGTPTARHQVVMGWEVNELQDDGHPFQIFKYYTRSLDKKATLRKNLVSWRGRDFTPEELKGFSLKKLIGVNCMLNVIHNEKGRAKISAVTAMPKGLPAIAPSVGQDVPAWIEKKRLSIISEERAKEIWAAAKAMANGADGDTDDVEIPF